MYTELLNKECVMVDRVTGYETMTATEVVGQKLESAAGDIIAQTKAQIDLWRQVPYLALMADGKTGYSNVYSQAYRLGMYRISGTAEGLFGLYVDCDSGDLLWLRGKVDLEARASTRQIVEAWFAQNSGSSRFDAQAVIGSLSQEAGEPTRSFMEQPGYREDWREVRAIELGLSELFTRHVEMAKVE